MKRQHPYALLGYTSKNFWLLLIPLVRGLAALKFDFYRWAEGAEWDILVLTAMIAAAVIRWYFTRYEISDDCMRVTVGMVIRRSMEVPYKNVCAATTEESPLHRCFGIVKAYVDTDAASGRKKSADISLFITKADRARLFNCLSGEFSKDCTKKGITCTYKVSKPGLIVFSLLFSSALSGVTLLITVLSGGTDIIGQQLERDFLNIVNGLSDAVAGFIGKIIAGISPAGIAVSIIIGAGFLISFVINIMRHINFTASRRGKCIIISGGLVVRRMYCINSRKINMTDMRQNLLMKFFRVTSVHVNCTGYGKRKNEIPVFVPICPEKKVYGRKGTSSGNTAMDMLLPGFSRCESYINPKATYIWRFMWPPALLIFAVLGAGLCLLVYFPHWHSLIAFLTVMCEIPSVWLLFVKACAYCTNGVNITDASVCAKYCSGYDFHTVNVPRERVAEIRIYQSIFQRMNRSCDVIIYTSSEYIGSHRVRNIPITEVQELLGERF